MASKHKNFISKSTQTYCHQKARKYILSPKSTQTYCHQKAQTIYSLLEYRLTQRVDAVVEVVVEEKSEEVCHENQQQDGVDYLSSGVPNGLQDVHKNRVLSEQVEQQD